ncbi:MAG: hypothetical protein PHV09_04975 [Bacteroidales bacterium]|jgi:hypothetical protein|nr:hypothetical protein [Bacteroidales bacterium]MDD2280648.1 hypothetical protein [Bacteroidales bacterium]MDD4292641.1 hypothetical protein [Bacteroidales bacterium]MDD4491859.1 hypothetical protein [Bacteroidales bacterium]
MKETLEIRINYDYANLLFKADEGKNLGTTVKVVKLSKDDPRYKEIPVIADVVKRKYDRGFFFGWEYRRKYTKKELELAKLFQIKIKVTFEPSGVECGTLYDETVACEICGANRKQVSLLTLKKGTIPKMDIAKTIGGEIVVSDKFANAVKVRNLKGLQLTPINFEVGVSDYSQLVASSEIELSPNTVVGINPFNLSTSDEGEIYKCPQGDTIGLNLLSEAYVLNNSPINDCDFLRSKQNIGVKRGLLRPEPIYFCSLAFRKMIEEEKLTGFEFEITNIE